MPNLLGLKSEIAGDPLGRGYSGMSDAEIATDLNTAYRPDGTKAISVAETELAIREAGKWVAWQNRANARNSTTGDIENAAMYEIMSVFDSRLVEINWRDSYWSVLLDQAVTDGDLGAAAAEGFKAQSDATQSRAQELQLGFVDAAGVARAKALP